MSQKMLEQVRKLPLFAKYENNVECIPRANHGYKMKSVNTQKQKGV